MTFAPGRPGRRLCYDALEGPGVNLKAGSRAGNNRGFRSFTT